MKNEQNNPTSRKELNNDENIVIPGHVVEKDLTFKQENEGEVKIPGVHAENVAGTPLTEEK